MTRYTFVVAMTAATAAIMPLATLAQTYRARALTITHPWIAPVPAGASTAAAYLTIVNSGAAPDRLLGATTPVAARATLHRSGTMNGMSHMATMSAVSVTGRGQAVFAPGGLHLMLEGLTKPLAVGQTVPVMLRFERAGLVQVGFRVEPAR